MADIKQAAKWMLERKNVKRHPWKEGFYWQKVGGLVKEVEDGKSNTPSLFVLELLAEDWEIAP